VTAVEQARRLDDLELAMLDGGPELIEALRPERERAQAGMREGLDQLENAVPPRPPSGDGR
jgi:hypothetical protein